MQTAPNLLHTTAYPFQPKNTARLILAVPDAPLPLSPLHLRPPMHRPLNRRAAVQFEECSSRRRVLPLESYARTRSPHPLQTQISCTVQPLPSHPVPSCWTESLLYTVSHQKDPKAADRKNGTQCEIVSDKKLRVLIRVYVCGISPEFQYCVAFSVQSIIYWQGKRGSSPQGRWQWELHSSELTSQDAGRSLGFWGILGKNNSHQTNIGIQKIKLIGGSAGH